MGVVSVCLAAARLGLGSCALLCALSIAGSCAPATLSPVQRLVVAHNALENSGFARLGRVREGSLAEGQSIALPLPLEARCYTIAAFGADTARALSLSIGTEARPLLAESAGNDNSPFVRWCAPSAGTYRVTIRMAQGFGAWALAAWSGARPSSTSDHGRNSSAPLRGSCAAAAAVALSSTIVGDTRMGVSSLSGNCFAFNQEAVAPELVYRVDVPRTMLLTAHAQAPWDVAVSLRRYCAESVGDLACAYHDDANGAEARWSAVVDRGTYFIVVDSRSDSSGEFTLELDGRDAPSAEQVCNDATPITLGVALDARNVCEPDRFRPSCVWNVSGSDKIFRFDLDVPSRVQAMLDVTGGLPILSLRRSCNTAERDRACSHTSMSSVRAAEINETLPAGRWYAVVNNDPDTTGSIYRLQVNAFAAGQPALAVDTCATAKPLTIPGSTSGNTFTASDDLRAPCGEPEGGLDQVFRLDLHERSLVSVSIRAAFAQAKLFWVDRCDPSATDARRCADMRLTEASTLDAVLDAGTHFLVVEASSRGAFGQFVLRTDASLAAPIERACASAPLLPANRRVRGAISGRGLFNSACSDVQSEAERVYRLQIQRPSRVTITAVSTSGTDAAGDAVFIPSLSLRTDCARPSSELTCSLGSGDLSSIERALAPGTYWLFVDGAVADNGRATYTLNTIVEPQ